MAGIDPDLNRKLMATLRRCDVFNSNAALRSVFVDARLSPWAYNVPEAGSTYSRVQATIAFLHDKANTQGQNALVLLLQVLQDRYDPADAFYNELGLLAAALGGGAAPLPSSSSHRVDYEAGLRNLLARLGKDHPRYSEVLVYQQRLDENLRNTRLFGDTEARRSGRAEIIMQLNTLSLDTLGVTFNDLAGMATPAETTIDTGGGAYAGGDVTAGRDFVGRDRITIIGDGNVIGDNNQVAVGQATSPGQPTASSTASGSPPGLPDRLALLNLLSRHFSLDELNTLCFAVGVNYDELPGEGLTGKARELISYCERHLCLPKLVEAGKTLRPELDWA